MKLWLLFISSVLLPQREALMNIGPINAPIWSNLNGMDTVIIWSLHLELSLASQKMNYVLKHSSLETTPTNSTYLLQQTSQCHYEGTDSDKSKYFPFRRLQVCGIRWGHFQPEIPGACCLQSRWADLSSFVNSTHYKYVYGSLALLWSLVLG